MNKLGEPPERLSPDEQETWRELAAAAPWGEEADRPAFELLVRLVAATRKRGLPGPEGRGDLMAMIRLFEAFGMTPKAKIGN